METNYKPQNILTQSDRMSEEYCCNIIRVGELHPIPGSDFLVQTFINGDSVVVRKDEVKTGDIFFFAMCECQLSQKYLGHHSMFRRSGIHLNDNYTELEEEVYASKEKKRAIEKLDKRITLITKFLKQKTIGNELIRYSNLEPREEEPKYVPDEVRKGCKAHLETDRERLKTMKAEYDEMCKALDKKCGFFEPTGRVKGIKLKQTPSMGFMFSQESLAAVWPEVAELNLEDYIGYDFDTVCGELFCKVYVPKLPKTHQPGVKFASKIAEDVAEGEFAFHYDTSIIGKNLWRFMPENIIDVTDKIHGTSFIMSNCHVQYTKNLPGIIKFWNKLVSAVKLNKLVVPEPKCSGLADVFSSRKLIRNTEFRYGEDPVYPESIYGLWASQLKGLLKPGQTLYGEIYGWDPFTNKPIQPGYTYGCKPGESILMPYRMTEIVDYETGETREYTITQVLDWTNTTFNDMDLDDPRCKVMPMARFYHGSIRDLYPDVDYNSENWRDEVLILMAKEKRFMMEELDQRCDPPVPREGVVIRRLEDREPAAYKLKCVAFKEREAKCIDTGQISDTEMEEAYS